jgi:hypothetical protein
MILLAGPPVAAQQGPPVRGTLALEGAMKTVYGAAHVIVVTTIDGVEHVYHFTKDLVVHGGRGHGADALKDLREGTTVVVHYLGAGSEASVRELDVVGEEGLDVTEGQVVKISRSRGEITLRYDNGKTETFRLTPRAAAEKLETAAAEGMKVEIYYADDHGRKVAHFFKRVEK